jgi:hypothetical protein
MARAQRPGGRVLGPAAFTDEAPASLADAGALYAGQSVARIRDVKPAAELVEALRP